MVGRGCLKSVTGYRVFGIFTETRVSKRFYIGGEQAESAGEQPEDQQTDQESSKDDCDQRSHAEPLDITVTDGIGEFIVLGSTQHRV